MILQIQISVDDNADEGELQQKIFGFFRNMNGVEGILIEKYIPLEIWETILDRDENGKVIVNDERKETK